MIDLALGGVALVVAALAGWAHLPVSQRVDAEYWFKLFISNLLLGEVERSGGDAEAWRLAVRRFAPYHPAGREAEEKLRAPGAWHPPAGGALDGELGLVEALRALPGPEERWKRLFDDDPTAAAALLLAPEELGAAAALPEWLGAGAKWDEVIAGGEAFERRLRAALPARWVLVGDEAGRPAVLAALAAAVGEHAERVEAPTGTVEQAGAALGEALAARWAVLAQPDARFVLVGAGEAVPALLAALLESPGLRDRVLAVVSVGGALGAPSAPSAPPAAGWVARHFEHARLDTEKAGKTPYLHLIWCDPRVNPPGLPGLPASAQRFPKPGPGAAAPWGVEVVDLGLLPPDPELPVSVIARALWATVVRVVLARRLA